MALAKLEIIPLDEFGSKLYGKKIKVLFNPETYSISKAVYWDHKPPDTTVSATNDSGTNRKFNAVTLDFRGGGNRTLSMELFYDVTEPIRGKRLKDVRILTNRLVELTRIDRMLQRPPILHLVWGHSPKKSDFPFTGVITDLKQTFNLFSNDGKPLRADLSVSLQEYCDAELDQRETDPELTTRRIRRGDTLSSIAAEVYHDPALWRVIADANHIDDPRRLDIGASLSIPDRS